jgi:transposase
MFDALMKNCFFYISRMYEFLHRLGHSRPGRAQQQVRPCPLCTESGSKFKAFVKARPLLWVDGAARDVIEAPKLEPWIVRYELSDFEWAAIKPFLPNKSRGVRRVNDRRVLNGIFWVLRSGAPWRDLPVCYGPRTTCYNRFVRWRKAGVWDRIMVSLATAHDAAVQTIHTPSCVCISTPPVLLGTKPIDGSLTRRKPTASGAGLLGARRGGGDCGVGGSE